MIDKTYVTINLGITKQWRTSKNVCGQIKLEKYVRKNTYNNQNGSRRRLKYIQNQTKQNVVKTRNLFYHQIFSHIQCFNNISSLQKNCYVTVFVIDWQATNKYVCHFQQISWSKIQMDGMCTCFHTERYTIDCQNSLSNGSGAVEIHLGSKLSKKYKKNQA